MKGRPTAASLRSGCRAPSQFSRTLLYHEEQATRAFRTFQVANVQQQRSRTSDRFDLFRGIFDGRVDGLWHGLIGASFCHLGQGRPILLLPRCGSTAVHLIPPNCASKITFAAQVLLG